MYVSFLIKYLATSRPDQFLFFCFATHISVYYESKVAALFHGQLSLPVCFQMHLYVFQLNFRLWAFLNFRSSGNRFLTHFECLSRYDGFGATVGVFTVFTAFYPVHQSSTPYTVPTTWRTPYIRKSGSLHTSFHGTHPDYADQNQILV